MFETETVVLCLLAIIAMLGIILAINKKHSIKKLSYDQWMLEINNIFYNKGFSAGYTEQLNQRRWREYYDLGMSPKDAVNEYLMI